MAFIFCTTNVYGKHLDMPKDLFQKQLQEFFFWFLFLLNVTTIKIIIIIIIIKNNYEEHRMKGVFSIKQLNDLTSHVYLTHFINTALGLRHYMDLVISYGFHHFVIKSHKTSSMFSAMGEQCFRQPSPEEM